MKDLTLSKNGKYTMTMKPDDAVDAAMLEAMSKVSATNPASLTMTFVDGVATITAEVRK